jgi:hypothetical protein
MASTKDLAGLAALGALGYMINQQGNKVDLTQPESSGDSNPNRGAGYNSTETRLNTPSQSIAAADQSSKGSISTRGDFGVTTPGLASAPNLDYKSAAPVSQKPPAAPTAETKAVKPQAKPSQQNLPPANKSSASTASSKPVDTTNYSNEGRAGVGPDMRGKPQAGNRNPRTGRPMPFSDTAPTSTRTARPLPPGARFVPGFGAVDENDNIIPGYMGGYNPDAATSGTSSRNPRTGRQMTTFKKGGAVKMASGGATSSASRRADGIATKGKTRGKIC